jgi:hypothetical protein
MGVTAVMLPGIMGDRKTHSILEVGENLCNIRTARLAGILQLVFSIWVVTMVRS